MIDYIVENLNLSLQILFKRKNDELHKVCTACGYQGSDSMESQKLTTYIAKNLRDAIVRRSKKIKLNFILFIER